MTFYLRRYWKENVLVSFFLVVLCGLQVGANMLMMQSFQGIIDIVCQMLHVTLIGLLSVQGVIIQGALTGGGNLCGKISVRIGQSAKTNVEPNTEIRTEVMQSGITMSHVSFCYDKKMVVKDFSAYFEKGGKYALIGSSGCGKSTLLKLILGCLPEYEGSICLDDREIRACRPEQIWQQISYIEQDTFLFNTSIRDNITLGESFAREQIRKALRDSALEKDLLSMPDGLDTVVGENGGNLSGGQKQRVAIARALLHNRSVLLVDEGTSALDQGNADRIEKNLLSKSELTLILVSHHLSAEQKKRFSQVFSLSEDY